MKYIKPELVEKALANSKGQFMGAIVDKVLKKGETVPVERKYGFKICPENAPTFNHCKGLVSIRESNGAFRSFYTDRVKYLKVNGVELVA